MDALRDTELVTFLEPVCYARGATAGSSAVRQPCSAQRAPLRGRLSVDDRSVRGPMNTAIEFAVVTQPRRQFFGGRTERQQVREDAPWSFGEERILVDAVRKQRRRKRERFGLVAQLVAGGSSTGTGHRSD